MRCGECIAEVISLTHYITDLTFLYPPCAALSGVNALHDKNNKAKRTANKRMRQRSRCFVMGLDFT